MLEIENFRGITKGKIDFRRETLLVGGNNVGKSTVCEALDLVLGAERLYRRPVINEHDFFKSTYVDDGEVPKVITIRAILLDLTEPARRSFGAHLRAWDDEAGEFLDAEVDGIDRTGDESVSWALPLVFLGRYDREEDDFEGQTFFDHPPPDPTTLDEEEAARLGQGRSVFHPSHKRLCGFIFLRTIRTGSRALSLQRGSLLDSILRLSDGGTSEMWEETLQNLKNLNPPIGDTKQLKEMTGGLQERLSRFLNLPDGKEATAFFASDLTRDHLREVVRLFVATEPSGYLVPRSNQGTGALNLLVFTLLTFIADLNGNNGVIFAMEEPEIALPPHIQRRLIRFVQRKMGQVIVTSHSPYVIEQFDPDSVVMLSQAEAGLQSHTIDPTGVKVKTYRSNRRQFAEAILARAVLVVEGSTEAALFYAASSVLERLKKKVDPKSDYDDFDMSGVTVFAASGDGDVDRWGPIFKALEKETFGCCDLPRAGKTIPTENRRVFDGFWESTYPGIEELLLAECPEHVLRSFLEEVEARDDAPDGVPLSKDVADVGMLQRAVKKVLKKRKGESWSYAALLIEHCQSVEDVPESIREILESIATDLNQVEDVPTPDIYPADESTEKESEQADPPIESDDEP